MQWGGGHCSLYQDEGMCSPISVLFKTQLGSIRNQINTKYLVYPKFCATPVPEKWKIAAHFTIPLPSDQCLPLLYV